jgi:PAS domain S-box-containing protein
MLDNALDSFIAIDENSRIVEWSRQAENDFGWSREEVLGQVLTDTIIPARYRAAHLTGIKRLLESGQHRILGRRIELYALRRDGTEIPVELTVVPIVCGVPGQRRIFSAALRDITRRRLLEQQLQRHADITRAILDSMADAVVVADTAERLILVNPAAQRLLNLKSADKKKRSIASLVSAFSSR